MFKTKEKREMEVQQNVDAAAKVEQERRAWCIEKATWMEEVTPLNVLEVADKLYRYVYGERG